MSQNIRIVDNFLPKDQFEELQNVMTSAFFPWYFVPYIVYDYELDNLHLSQFTHKLFTGREGTDSAGYKLIRPIIEKLNVKAICRIKANLLVKTEKIREHAFHTDFYNNRTAIYYVNTNNGYTKFEDGQKINSVENRLIEFDSNLKHSGSTCTDQKCRIVVNINYYPFIDGESL
tara:strand:+ start:200 stop:721 length:522 start_codon:yes stop_codon:yes gene_type:complete